MASKVKPYLTVGYKTTRTRVSILSLGLLFLGLLNYILFFCPPEHFIEQMKLLLPVTFVVGYTLYRMIRSTKHIRYRFEKEGIEVQYQKNKKIYLKKDDIGRVRSLTRDTNKIGISKNYNAITKEKYFTTSKYHLVGIYMRDKTTFVLSPRIIKPWIFTHYDSPKLVDRF